MRYVNLLIFLMLGDQLAHNTPHRPHLYSCVVFRLHQYDLRSTVPATHNVRGHHRAWLRIFQLAVRGLFEAGSSETEIAKLDIVVIVREDVLGLQVSVQYLYR